MLARSKILLVATVAALSAPAAAQAWTKSFVAEWFEPAFYYGGPAGGKSEDPGTDCPKGINNYEVTKDLGQPYRTAQRLADLNSAEFPLIEKLYARAFRGPNAENMYENPTVQKDPGFVEVSGRIAEGFNLDGDETTGFTGVNGEKGIDNAFYRTSGCIRRWRGPPRTSSTGAFQNDGMRNGMYTIVFVLSGKGADPMNDDDITVGIYDAKDAIVKDAAGQVAADYTYRVVSDPAFQTVLKAKSRNGVVESVAPTTIRTHDMMQGFQDRPWLILEQGRARITLKPDGTADALLGGYRDWFEQFRNPMGNGGVHQGAGNGVVQGTTAEGIGRFNAVGWYYALRRNADGLKDAKSGQNTGISSAYRYALRPAFVVTPNADAQVTVAQIYDR